PMKRRANTHTAITQDSSPPVPWRWRSCSARIRGLQGTSPQTGCSARRGDPSAWFCWARRRCCQSHCSVLSNCLFFLVQRRPCAGEAAVINHKSVLQTGTTQSREVSARIGVTSDEAENPPRLRVANGEDSQESFPPVNLDFPDDSLVSAWRLRLF